MDDLFGFDGAEDLGRAWRDGLTPDPALTVSQWADRHRVLSPRDSAEPGRYRTDRTPYMRAIMDALSPAHPAWRVYARAAAWIAGADRWTAAMWRDLERQVGVSEGARHDEPGDETHTDNVAGVVRRRPERRARRVFRSSCMS